ncbi:hypothetical protein A2957_02945 [Candidatus Roizmanbacteria bacterium RIFCSPLOWO2_01_FULL_38_11]|uniref:Endolytic murein transglycosylase n=1 Tax=Candidatus Roizmanbacteria bacterium RIFCSPLOWO2_01_FULL_38_11 TaxID=1802060 RepID=A0A1F7IJZ8_9BACT|nr:MAG: hypothetical protein A2957_02945 [Candidatus Roizmanbacteria bacterium RIFCSPLOWO2_01_FULL_38_11]
MKKIKIFLLLCVFLALLAGIFYYEGSLPANSKSKEQQIFVVEKGSSVNQIINKLSNEGYIRNKIVFLAIIKQLGIENNLQAGDYRISKSMSAKEIAESFTKGTLDTWVTVIEGLRKEEIAQILSKNFDIPEIEFIQKSTEGKLYPDTYLIPKSASIQDVLAIFDRNLNKKYSPELREEARQKGLSDNEVLTLASLVEREANSTESKREVASILYKRLRNDWPLQVDATIQYVLGYQERERSWWKRNLSKSDLEIQSLYNTYARPGLPPGPICSPGIDSIEAVINANENTPYWFYISNKDGSKLIYSKTIEEHNRNISKYLN